MQSLCDYSHNNASAGKRRVVVGVVPNFSVHHIGVFFLMKYSRKAKLAAIASMGLMAAGASHAALDAAVTTAITAAGTDLGLLYTALTTAGATLFVLRLIYRKFTLR